MGRGGFVIGFEGISSFGRMSSAGESCVPGFLGVSVGGGHRRGLWRKGGGSALYESRLR